ASSLAGPRAMRSLGDLSPPSPARGAPTASSPSAFDLSRLPADEETMDSSLMELLPSVVEHRTLEDYLVAGRKWDPRQAAAVLAEIAEAVEVLHGRKRIHGDLSPAEIPMHDEGHSAVMPLPDRWLRSTQRPRAEVFSVTPYTAPERLKDPTGPLGPPVDVYSL